MLAIYPSSMTAAIETIRDDFTFLDDWEDRYRYVIDLGNGLAPYPEELRDGAHKVPGCVSQVWLHADRGEGSDPVIDFLGDSDAHIVRGLVAIMIAFYSGRRASEIATADARGLAARSGPRRTSDPAARQWTPLDDRVASGRKPTGRSPNPASLTARIY